MSIHGVKHPTGSSASNTRLLKLPRKIRCKTQTKHKNSENILARKVPKLKKTKEVVKIRNPPANLSQRENKLESFASRAPSSSDSEHYQTAGYCQNNQSSQTSSLSSVKPFVDELRRAERKKRFGLEPSSTCTPGPTLQEARLALVKEDVDPEFDCSLVSTSCSFSNLPVFGTNTALEKPYFRLTSAPALETIRPPSVLERALALAKKKWREAVAANRPDYKKAAYVPFTEQLKSIRQDLTVQSVRSPLTVEVYETHARVALEVGDMAEYTCCASCLKRLYAEGLPGNEGEFAAYRLLAAAAIGTEALSLELISLAERRRAFRPDPSQHGCVEHALSVVRAVSGANFHRFFCLYASAPRMSAYLMDALAGGVRRRGLAAIAAAHGRELDAAFVCRELGFDLLGDLQSFAAEQGAAIDVGCGTLDPAAMRSALRSLPPR